MAIIAAIIGRAFFWTGVYTASTKVFIPALEGVVDGIKTGRKEYKESKNKK